MSNVHPIKAYRERQNPPLSQGKLASKWGVTRFTIIRWEKGAPIDAEKLSTVSNDLGIPAKELRPDLVEKYEEIFGGAA